MTDPKKKKIQITDVDPDEPTHLFEHYPGQHEPQPVYVYLNLESGELYMGVDPHVGGGTSEEIYNGRVRRFYTKLPLTPAGAGVLLREAAPIAQRILDGAFVERDPRNGNLIGYLDIDADPAEDELIDLTAEWSGPCVLSYDAGDWYSEGPEPEVSADTTDDELEAIAAAAQLEAQEIHEGDFTFIAGIDEYLKDYRSDRRQEARERLAEIADTLAAANTEVEPLVEERNKLIKSIMGFGDGEDSTRSVGELASLSHVRVQKIAHS